MNKKQLPLYLLIGCIIPIILFATVVFAVPCFIRNMDMPTEYDKDTAWGRIFFMNDKISYLPIDSIKYLGNQSKEYFKNQGLQYAADITSLFADFNARKITVVSDLGEHYALQIWNNNGSVYYLNSLTYYKRGQWIGYITSNDSIQSSQKINLGRVDGSGYSTKERIIDVSGTYLNGFLILTICILAICFIIYVSSNHFDGNWLIWVIILGILLVNLPHDLLYDIYGSISISETYMIETIIVLFCICEFGIICTLLSFSMTSKTPTKR